MIKFYFVERQETCIPSKWLACEDGTIWRDEKFLLFHKIINNLKVFELWRLHLDPIYLGDRKKVNYCRQKMLLKKAFLSIDFWHYINTGRIKPCVTAEEVIFAQKESKQQKPFPFLPFSVPSYQYVYW